MMLSDLRDYIDSLHFAERVYMGKLDAKSERSIGVYNSKHEHPYKTALGGPACESYGIKYVTLLVHWNKSPRDTERAAQRLSDALTGAREVNINETHIKFVQLLTGSPVDVGTDDAGVYEMVVEVAVIFSKGDQYGRTENRSVSGI